MTSGVGASREVARVVRSSGEPVGGPPVKDMVWVPSGTFLMGSNDFYPEEAPAHRVSVDGFWIDQHPVTNAELTRALGRAVHRPALLMVPPAAVRIVVGELGSEIKRSQRVLPAVLERASFPFAYPDIDTALRQALGHIPVRRGDQAA